MISSRFAYAFSAGLVAAINPCGFALLPTYLAYFLGIDNEETSQRIGSDLGRAIKVGAALTAGFLTVFAIMGVLWGSLASVVKENIPWAGLVIGVLLIVGGIAMLRGYEPTIRLPRFDKGGSSRAIGSIYVYGISYAIASLSCTLPIFAATLTASIDTEGAVQSATVILAYGLGMGTLVTALTIATSMAKAGLLSRLRNAMGMIGKVSGVWLIVAGVFVAWYAWSEIRIVGGDTENAAFDQVTSWQGRVQNWIATNQSTVAWVCGGVIAAAAIFALVQWRTNRPNSAARAE